MEEENRRKRVKKVNEISKLYNIFFEVPSKINHSSNFKDVRSSYYDIEFHGIPNLSQFYVYPWESLKTVIVKEGQMIESENNVRNWLMMQNEEDSDQKEDKAQKPKQTNENKKKQKKKEIETRPQEGLNLDLLLNSYKESFKDMPLEPLIVFSDNEEDDEKGEIENNIVDNENTSVENHQNVDEQEKNLDNVNAESDLDMNKTESDLNINKAEEVSNVENQKETIGDKGIILPLMMVKTKQFFDKFN